MPVGSVGIKTEGYFCVCLLWLCKVCYTVVLSAAVLVFMLRCNHYRSAAALAIVSAWENKYSCTCVSSYMCFLEWTLHMVMGRFFFPPVVIFFRVSPNGVVMNESASYNHWCVQGCCFCFVFFLFFCPTLLCSVTTQTVQSHNNLQLTLVL